jgi:hypothetical protein
MGILIFGRFKLGLVIVALFMAAVATLYCVWAFSYTLVEPRGRINWIPLAYFVCMNALCLYSAWALNTGNPNRLISLSVWIAQGLLLGFVIAGMWSIGFFFAPSWLLLTLLALIDLIYARTSVALAAGLIVLMILCAAAQIAFLIIAPQLYYLMAPTSGSVPALPAPTATVGP